LDLGLKEAAVLPSMTFIYSDISGNKITVSEIKTNKTGKSNDPAGNVSYSAVGNLENPAQDQILALYSNIAALSRGKMDPDDFIHYAAGDFLADVLRPFPHLSRRQVENCYATIAKDIYSGEGLFNYAKAARYLSHTGLSMIAAGLFTDKDSADATGTRKRPRDFFHDIVEREKDLVFKHAQHLTESVTSPPTFPPGHLHYCTFDDDGKPVVATEAQFYGKLVVVQSGQ
jgi:hypothetical protein